MEQLRASIIASRTPPKMPSAPAVEPLIELCKRECLWGLVKELEEFKKRRK